MFEAGRPCCCCKPSKTLPKTKLEDIKGSFEITGCILAINGALEIKENTNTTKTSPPLDIPSENQDQPLEEIKVITRDNTPPQSITTNTQAVEGVIAIMKGNMAITGAV